MRNTGNRADYVGDVHGPDAFARFQDAVVGGRQVPQLNEQLVLLLEGAVDCLTVDEGTPIHTAVRLSDALDKSRVPSTTAYRHLAATRYAGRPQDQFTQALHDYLAFMVDHAAERPRVVRSEALVPLRRFGEPRPSMAGLRRCVSSINSSDRGLLLCEMVRRGGNANVRAYEGDRHFRAFLLLARASDHASTLGRVFRFSDLYHQFANAFGFQLRAEYEWVDFANAVSGLAESLREEPEDPDHGWSTFASAVMALIYSWFTPDDAHSPHTVLPACFHSATGHSHVVDVDRGADTLEGHA